jgi:signal transduction histidine kinase
MGIGVYESAQYVNTLGGEVSVESAPGTGTRVRLVLPKRDGAAREVVADERTAGAPAT